jgi:molecular chaperone GrpE
VTDRDGADGRDVMQDVPPDLGRTTDDLETDQTDTQADAEGVTEAVTEAVTTEAGDQAGDLGADVEAVQQALEVGSDETEPATGPELTPEHPDTLLAAERLADLQRLQAEYVNYKRRVDRDRAMVQELAVHSVLEALLPVLDDIHAARQHGDLESGPFAAIAEKLESVLGKFGLVRFGATGESFDPSLHEALMHAPWPGDGSLPEDVDATTVVQVFQPGYRAGERVIRPARVAVADPE